MLLDALTDNPAAIEVEKAYLASYRGLASGLVARSEGLGAGLGARKPRRRCAMATDLHAAESFPPPGLDEDALKFYEVVDGKILENPSMGAQESFLAGLLMELDGHLSPGQRLGRVATETLFLIDRARNLKRRPDLAFISNSRWPLKRARPTDRIVGRRPRPGRRGRQRDQLGELRRDQDRGIFPGRREEGLGGLSRGCKNLHLRFTGAVRILQRGDDLDGEDLLPGFRVALTTLFEEGEEGPAGRRRPGAASGRLTPPMRPS